MAEDVSSTQAWRKDPSGPSPVRLGLVENSSGHVGVRGVCCRFVCDDPATSWPTCTQADMHSGRHLRQTSQADISGRHLRQTTQADISGRHQPNPVPRHGTCGRGTSSEHGPLGVATAFPFGGTINKCFSFLSFFAPHTFSLRPSPTLLTLFPHGLHVFAIATALATTITKHPPQHQHHHNNTSFHHSTRVWTAHSRLVIISHPSPPP